MSAYGALLPFGADLVLFLAAASLVATVVLRADLVRASRLGRSVLAAGAATLAASAFLRGTMLDRGHDSPAPSFAVAAAATLIALGAALVDFPAIRRILWTAAFALGAGTFLAGHSAIAAGARAYAGVAIALALALAARREIATRIAVVAGSLLIVVVLVLSGILSAVLDGNVSREALRRTDARARTETGILEATADRVLKHAAFIARTLESSPEDRRAIRAGDSAALRTRISLLQSPEYRVVDFLVLFPAFSPPVWAGIDAPDAGAIPGRTALVRSAPATSVVRLTGTATVAVGTAAVRAPDARGVSVPVGVVAAGVRFDDAFLVSQLGDDESLDLSLVVSDGLAATTLARSPASLSSGEIVKSVFEGGVSVIAKASLSPDVAFLAARPVRAGDGSAVAAFVVTADGDLVAGTLTALLRTLFLVALGAAAVAIALAAAAGHWIGRPLRRLRDASERISGGDLTARAGGGAGGDEVGVLGRTFDAMASSVERMTGEQRAAAARMEAILTGMAEGIVAADPDGVIVAANPAAERLLDVPGGSAAGRRVPSVIRGRDRNDTPFARHLERSSETWSASGFLELDGRSLPVEISSTLIRRDDGVTQGRLFVIRDMRGEHALERMKSEFLSNISHELRTPLTPIRGYADILRRRTLPRAQAQAFLSTIAESAERLERIINVLVNFAAIEGGRPDIGDELVDVCALARDVCERWQARAQHTIQLEVGARVPRVRASRRLIDYALEELIDNAVKYSPDGGRITVRVRAATNDEGRFVEISVADRGIGIEAEELEHVFDEFRQVDGSPTRRYGGLGLGLSFVRRVARAHKGRLAAASEAGKGSIFTLALPVSPSQARRPATPKPGNGATPVSRARETGVA
jgi:PAS domain S-box-containing protein